MAETRAYKEQDSFGGDGRGSLSDFLSDRASGRVFNFVDTRNIKLLAYDHEVKVKPSAKNLPVYGFPINRGPIEVKVIAVTYDGRTVFFNLKPNEWLVVTIKRIIDVNSLDPDIRILK